MLGRNSFLFPSPFSKCPHLTVHLMLTVSSPSRSKLLPTAYHRLLSTSGKWAQRGGRVPGPCLRSPKGKESGCFVSFCDRVSYTHSQADFRCIMQPTMEPRIIVNEGFKCLHFLRAEMTDHHAQRRQPCATMPRDGSYCATNMPSFLPSTNIASPPPPPQPLFF